MVHADRKRKSRSFQAFLANEKVFDLKNLGDNILKFWLSQQSGQERKYKCPSLKEGSVPYNLDTCILLHGTPP